MGTFLLIVGLLIAIAGNLWFLVLAFRESAMWGVGVLIVPLVGIIFLILHFRDAWKPFAINAIGLLMLVTGMGMMAPSEDEMYIPSEPPPAVSSEE